MKMIISDLDGTLLKEKKQSLDLKTLNLIEKLLDKGFYFAVATGRQYPNAYRMFGKLAENIIYICENGSLIISKHKILYRGKIEMNLCKDIVKSALENKSTELMLSGIMTSFINPRNYYFYDLVANRMQNNVLVLEDLMDFDETCVKVSIYQKDKISSADEKKWKGKYENKLTVAKSSEKWLDFVPLGTDKGAALERALKYFKISKRDCVVFGDQDNDIEMLKLIPNSYAMSCGSYGAKKIAKDIVSDVDIVLERML
ncbi:MAG: Cof-type HAD-IIB family hydrolase [Lachnospiraceae bacterium]